MFALLRLIVAPTLERYAAYWKQLLERRGIAAVYEPENLTYVLDADRRVYLGNLFDDLCRTVWYRRFGLLGRQKRGLLELPSLELGLEDALAHLMPRVNERVFFESLRAAEEPIDIPSLPLTENLAVCLVLDFDDSVAYVTGEKLAGWGRTLEDLLPVARTNLVRGTDESKLEDLGGGVFRSGHRDDYDDARMLLAPWLSKLPLPGRKLICVANRNCLLVTSDETQGGLARLLDVSARVMEDESRAMTGRVLCLEGFDLVEHTDDESSALFNRNVLAAARDCADQKVWLDERFERSGDAVYVAPLEVIEKPGVTRYVRQTRWPEGLTSLLPGNDEVLLIVDLDAEPRVERVSFQTVLARVPSLLEITDDYPTRYRTLVDLDGALFEELLELEAKRSR